MRYIVNHIPRGIKRTGLPLDWEYITIHNTRSSITEAEYERLMLAEPRDESHDAYHIVVDQRVAIECIPLDEIAWHAGDGIDGTGNRRSIGIAICKCGDFDGNVRHAIEVVAHLLSDNDKGVEALCQHHGWNGDHCPEYLREGVDGWTWERFVNAVNLRIHELSLRKKARENREVAPQERRHSYGYAAVL